jgi:hypothetical protein
MPTEGREYDPEIKDIASYVHNTPIDSELAVSLSNCCLLLLCWNRCPSTYPSTYCTCLLLQVYPASHIV